MEADMDSTTLLDEQQAADWLGLSVRTLQAWRYYGRGPTYLKLGSRVKYALGDLEAFLEQSRRESPDGQATIHCEV
jgi:Helix-turn-helix domain